MTLSLEPAKQHHINVNGKIVVKRPGGQFRVASVPEDVALSALSQCDQVECPHEKMGILVEAMGAPTVANNYILNHAILDILVDPPFGSAAQPDLVARVYGRSSMSNYSNARLYDTASSGLFVLEDGALLPPDAPSALPAGAAIRLSTSSAASFWTDPVTDEMYVKIDAATVLTSGFFPHHPYTIRQVGMALSVSTPNSPRPRAAALLPEPVEVINGHAVIVSYTAYFPMVNTEAELAPVVGSGQIQSIYRDIDDVETPGPLVDWEAVYYAGPRDDPDRAGITILNGWEYPGNPSGAVSRARALASKEDMSGWGGISEAESSLDVVVDPVAGTRTMTGTVRLPEGAVPYNDRQVHGVAIGGWVSGTPGAGELYPTIAARMFPLRIYFDPPLTKKWTESITIDFSFDVEADIRSEAPSQGPQIGDEYGGGIYIGDLVYPSGEYRLIWGKDDSETQLAWKVDDTDSPGAYTYFDGTVDTQQVLMNGPQDHPAAFYCDNYSADGFSDWFLPSWQEIAVVLENEDELEIPLENVSGVYWTSAQSPGSTARAIVGSPWGGGNDTVDKVQVSKVRPMRRELKS